MTDFSQYIVPFALVCLAIWGIWEFLKWYLLKGKKEVKEMMEEFKKRQEGYKELIINKLTEEKPEEKKEQKPEVEDATKKEM